MMYLYNVTYIVEESSANNWIAWVKGNHIPAIMSSDKFVSYRLLTVVHSPNEGITYCAQFIAESEADVNAYQTNFEQQHRAELQDKFPNKFVLFSTLMEFLA